MKEHANGITLSIALIVLGLLGIAWAAGNDTNQACVNSTLGCNTNGNTGQQAEFVMDSNRPISTPIFVARVAVPTAASGTPILTPITFVTPMPAGTPGPARGCLFHADFFNPQWTCIATGAASVTGTGCAGGRTWCCTNGVGLGPGEKSYQPAPNGDCGQYTLNADQMPTGINKVGLEIDPVP